MKSIRTVVIVPALLLAGVAHAQQPPAPATPVEAPNYISVGPAYARFDYKITGDKVGSGDSRNFFGVVFNYGRYFGESSVGVHEFGVQAGILGASEKDAGATVSTVEAPIVAVYNYNFKLGDSTRLYLGPRAGISVIGLAVDDDSTNFRESDSDVAAKFGVGVGIKQQIGKTFGIAVGYEYARYTSTSFRLQDSGATVDADIRSMNSHLFAVSATWTF